MRTSSNCLFCSTRIIQKHVGRSRLYCSTRCRAATCYKNNRKRRLDNQNRYYARHRTKINAGLKKLRLRNKRKGVAYLGGVCSKCKYVYPLCVYDFHHTNPAEKEIPANRLMHYKWSTVKKELDKCVLLCANCHRIEHHGVKYG